MWLSEFYAIAKLIRYLSYSLVSSHIHWHTWDGEIPDSYNKCEQLEAIVGDIELLYNWNANSIQKFS